MEDLKGILEFPCSVERLGNGNTLIADAGSETGRGSEIIEVNQAGEVVWCYSEGMRFAHTAKRLGNGNTLIADTSNDRIFEVDAQGEIIFSSDDWAGGTGKLSDGSHLNYPNNLVVMKDNELMITDRNSNRFILTDRQGNVSLANSAGLKHPHNCEPLENGNVIVADSDRNRAVEFDNKGNVAWEYADNLEWPRDANRLANNNTLIADSKNSRVIEVGPDKKVVWEYKVDYFANFYEAVRLRNNNTLISDQQHKQVIEVSPDRQIVWKFRNFKRDVPIYDKLTNGFFKKKDDSNQPLDWSLITRFSEGGGRFIWGENVFGKPVPGLEYDRPGALCLQQSVRVQPGRMYQAGCRLSTENLEGMACMQVAFKDELDGLLCDVTKAPKGESFSGDTPWTQDSFEVTVPEKAASADVRIFISGKGRVLFNEVRFLAAL